MLVLEFAKKTCVIPYLGAQQGIPSKGFILAM